MGLEFSFEAELAPCGLKRERKDSREEWDWVKVEAAGQLAAGQLGEPLAWLQEKVLAGGKGSLAS